MGEDSWTDVAGGVHPAVQAWFNGTFAAPTEPQRRAWPVIAGGDSALLLAPTGSGKTLAAFLMAINDLCQRAARGELAERVLGPQVLYISPLRALNNDIQRNLERPLAGIVAAAQAAGISLPVLRSAVRTGDTPPDLRRQMLREPPHILITTPESLFLLLCSKSREILRHVRTVIVDETHALFPNKRGVLLSLALEYLQELVPARLQRIGLSATQRPLADIAAFVAGGEATAHDGQGWQRRPITVIEAPGHKEFDLAISMPVADFADLPENTIWPEIHREVYRLATEHRTTLVFVNNRQVGERIAAAINDLAGEEFCRVHHGSISRELRLETEQMLKAGQLRCLVATSTLELGIDIGEIDLVVQVESPREVARAIQRVGRAGHVPGLPSKGRIIPKTRQDLLEATVISDLMRRRWIEPQAAPENALDVLAQFIVGLTIERERHADEIFALVRRAYTYRSLSRPRFDSVLAMIAGRFDTGEAVDLRPLVQSDAASGLVSAVERGRRLIYTSGGTIPDSGNYPVYLQGQGVRLGELDEEFVHERRIGDRFSLGTSGWRITEITHDRVSVVPAAGGPRVPFWKGETFGRPYLLGCELAGFLAAADQVIARAKRNGGSQRDVFWFDCGRRAGLAEDAVAALRTHLEAQFDATGHLPSARTLVIEEFRDELGQWRVVLHSPFGRMVNAPLALLLEEQLSAGSPATLDLVVTDDAILIGAGASELPPAIDLARLDASDLPGQLSAAVRRTLVFGRLFREAASRALVLPRLPHGRRRTPLWLSRRKAASLLQVAEGVPDFPLIHEALREALTSVYDLAGLGQILHGLATGSIEVLRVRRETPSPFARPALFAHAGAFFYAADLPPAERRLRFLGLDRLALQDLLGQAQLRELLDVAAIDAANAEAMPASLVQPHPVSTAALAAWLRQFGELPAAAVPDEVQPQLAELAAAGEAVEVCWAGPAAPGPVWIAAGDAPDYAWLTAQSAADAAALGRLARRYALRHSPFTAAQFGDYFGLEPALALDVLHDLAAQGVLRRGAFRPGGVADDWSDPQRLTEIHRRSLAIARQAVQPVAPSAYQLFLARWQGLGQPGRQGLAGIVETLSQLEGTALDAAAWEEQVLPARVAGYAPSMLDAATATGQFHWLAEGRLERLRISFWRTLPEAATAAGAGEAQPDSQTAAADPGLHPLARQVLDLLSTKGAQFTTEIWRSLTVAPAEVLAALESLLARGMVTNDTFGPVRHLLALKGHDRTLPRTVTAQMMAGMARWSALRTRPAADSPTAEETASRLLTRYGLVCREVAAAEGLSWPELLQPLSRMEILGRVRRGYFVHGLSGMQFALPAAVDSLRAAAQSADSAGLLAVGDEDPAWAWGRILPWPEGQLRPHPPAVLVLAGGTPVLAADGRPLRIWPLRALSPGELVSGLRLLLDLAQVPAGDRLEVATYDGQPVRTSAIVAQLEELGFSAAPLTMVRWAQP